jgi:hypothetical protein
MRRRAIGECASALLVILTTCSIPARPALSITLSSCERTGGVTRTTLETPRIAWSMLSGESRSPGKISTPAWARGATFSATFSGWRTSTRTGPSRWAMRRAAAEPTLPAVVIRIMVWVSVRVYLYLSVHTKISQHSMSACSREASRLCCVGLTGCVSGRGVLWRRASEAASEGCEGEGDAIARWEVGGDLVVAAAQVLHECVPGCDGSH